MEIIIQMMEKMMMRIRLIVRLEEARAMAISFCVSFDELLKDGVNVVCIVLRILI